MGNDGNDFIVLGSGTDNAEGGAGNDFFGYWGYDITPIAVLSERPNQGQCAKQKGDSKVHVSPAVSVSGS